MDLLQDADFDGDVLEIISLATNAKDQNATASEILYKTFDATQKRIDKEVKEGRLSTEEAKNRKERYKRSLGIKDGTYDM